ncbi:EcsC family protein [Domibacillus iocasae]|uniref:ABC transporter substrate-binding protein n=1 Tax=Domibacillus iocasae TaxID=1714016 RepID=A0A1E7DM43_9BACI|nr:EcsC family protein [Domibacillus iocasae]OES44141.1 ABC transporter substrate-binding protein [Domibacillus iocasae]
MWTKRDHLYWNQLMDWEQQLVSSRGNETEENDALDRITAFMTDDMQDRFFMQVDQSIEWIHSFLQKEMLQTEVRGRILLTARIFRDDIETVEQLRSLTIDQLHYISRQQASRNHAAAAVQGAITGTGSLVPIAADLLSMTAIGLHAIQTNTLSYGFDPSHPIEKENILHLFHVSLLPDHLKADGWAQLITEVEEGIASISDGSWAMDKTMLQEPLRHALKLAAVRTLRHQTISGVPLISMAIGAGANYRAVKQMTTFAERYYQYRYLHEKKNRS